MADRTRQIFVTKLTRQNQNNNIQAWNTLVQSFKAFLAEVVCNSAHLLNRLPFKGTQRVYGLTYFFFFLLFFLLEYYKFKNLLPTMRIKNKFNDCPPKSESVFIFFNQHSRLTHRANGISQIKINQTSNVVYKRYYKD